MGVDEHLLNRINRAPLPSNNANALFGSPRVQIQHKVAKPTNVRPADVGFRELRAEIKRLTLAVNELLAVFSKAHDDIKTEPTADLSRKMDKLIEQNEEIGRTLLLLLELHREHIPQIAKHTRLSHELRLRRPPAKLFSETIRK